MPSKIPVSPDRDPGAEIPIEPDRDPADPKRRDGGDGPAERPDDQPRI